MTDIPGTQFGVTWGAIILLLYTIHPIPYQLVPKTFSSTSMLASYEGLTAPPVRRTAVPTNVRAYHTGVIHL